MTSKPSACILQAVGVSKQVQSAHETLTILNQINLQVTEGETLAITGVSGSGKTTLLALLAGLDIPSAGQIYLAKKDLTTLDEDGRARLRGECVSFVFQNFQLLPHLTALENVMLALEIKQVSQPDVQATDILRQVGLEARLHHYPKTLSGGEQQRVALARAFVTKPKVLFADEPTGQLDPHTAESVTELLLNLNTQFKATLVLVTHDNAIAKLCARQMILKDGGLLPC